MFGGKLFFLLVMIFFSLIGGIANAKNAMPNKKVAVSKGKTQKINNPVASSTIGKSQMMRRAPASDPNAPIEVRGQSRNLNMLLILQNQNEAIDFIKMRKDYKNETERMSY